MSRKSCECNKPVNPFPAYGQVGCGCEQSNSFGLPILIILILVLLQFGKGGFLGGRKECECSEHDYVEEYRDDCEEEHEECERPIIDNGILFIIALFYLSCCGRKFC